MKALFSHKKIFLLIMLFVAVGTMKAQERFYVKANTTAYTGEYYQISFVLENANGSNFTAPSFEGFEIASGPNQSSSYQWINGKTTSSLSISYYLLPKEEGTFTIGSARVEVDNKSIVTETITVEVKEGDSPQQQQSNFSSGSGNNTSSTNLTDDWKPNDWQSKAAQNMFIRLYADNTTPYIGEQITVYAKLYQRVEAYNTQILDVPKYEGFWKQNIELSSYDWQKEEYNGEYYNTVMVSKTALFPQKDGALTISPYEIYTIIQVEKPSSRGGMWASFFQEYDEKEYTFQSNELLIDVKNLPIEGQPESFTGAVGNFDFETELDSTTIQLGSPLTYNTNIKGTGNIMMVEMPTIEFPRNLNVFDPTVDEWISEKSTIVNGKRDYEYILVPELPGTYAIPAVEFSYFDPYNEKYETIVAEKYRVIVEGEMPEKYLIDTTQQENALALEDDIYTIDTTDDLEKRQASFYGSTSFWAGMTSPVILFVLFLLVRRKIENYEPDLAALKIKKAQRVAQKKLKQAAIHLKKKEVKGFYHEVIEAMLDYASDKLAIEKAQLSKDNIAAKLTALEVSDAKIGELKALIVRCEMALFANISDDEMEKDFKTAQNLIIDIENELV